MMISWAKALLNSISEFNLSSTCNNITFEPAQRYYPRIGEVLKLLGPLLDEIVDSQISSDEQLNKALEELDAAVNEARKLIESWHQLTSKVYFVLQIESLMANVQMYGLEICKILNSLLLSPTDGSDPASIQHRMQKIQCIESEKTSDSIKEAMHDLQEDIVPSSEILAKIANVLSLKSNQELLLEAVALEKAKADHDRNDGEDERFDNMIAVIMHMHDSLMKIKQSQTANGVPIPADFCCPLSLELMSDPVIVASGQTYERAFIRKWLDQGLTVCPKTRQTLSHTNLIPNYTVKALIANWCEINNIKLPDPVKSASLNQPLALPAHLDYSPGDSHMLQHVGHALRTNHPRSPESTQSLSSRKGFILSNGAHPNDKVVSPSCGNSCAESGLFNGSGSSLVDVNGLDANAGSSKDAEVNSEERNVGSSVQTSAGSDDFLGHNRTTSASSAVSSNDYQQGEGDTGEGPQVSGELTHYSSDTSGELAPEGQAPSTSHREPELSPRLAEIRSSRSQTIWRQPPERLVPRIISSPSLNMRADLSGIESQVRNLIEDLESGSVEVQKAATHEIRVLAKHNMDNRIVIANCGAINHLVRLLLSTDCRIQENAVTALLNLSINDNNKVAIADADAIDPLIYVLKNGNAEAKENSAATLFSLSVIESNKVKIGRSGAIGPLVELLGNGTPRGKKDAATALFNLSIFHENKLRIVETGAVRYLVELMDPAAGMVDKAVAVLANLSTVDDGRAAIAREGGIPGLVEVVELGSSRGKENAAAALLQLCLHSHRFSYQVLQEGVIPPLVALSQSGTPRAREKAQSLLSHFRNQIRGNAGRN